MVAEVTNPKIYLLSLKELLVHTVRSLLTILWPMLISLPLFFLWVDLLQDLPRRNIAGHCTLPECLYQGVLLSGRPSPITKNNSN